MASTILKILLPLLHLLHTSTLADANPDDSANNGLMLRGAHVPPDQHNRQLIFLNYPSDIKPSSMISYVDSTQDTVTVKVQQSIIGDPNDCEGSDKAPFFFMVFNHGGTGEKICPFYRDVDACFEKTITLKCDPVTKRTGIDVYTALDRSGTLDPRDWYTDSPSIGKCFPDREDPLLASVKYSWTWKCPGTFEGKPTSCADVLALDPDAQDGEYMIWLKDPNGNDVDAKPVLLYCRYMHVFLVVPREFISLVDPLSNFSTYYAQRGLNTKVTYDKIRIDPVTLKVDVGDTRFMRYSFDAYHRVPYGYAGSVFNPDRDDVGAMIDLRGTDFKISDDQHFFADPPDQTILRRSYNGQKMEMVVKSKVGQVYPGESKSSYSVSPGLYDLQLALV